MRQIDERYFLPTVVLAVALAFTLFYLAFTPVQAQSPVIRVDSPVPVRACWGTTHEFRCTPFSGTRYWYAPYLREGEHIHSVYPYGWSRLDWR